MIFHILIALWVPEICWCSGQIELFQNAGFI